MTKEELAALLNGNEYGEEIDADEEKLAKENGLLVVFGYSDDNVEFRGLFSDEVGAFGGVSLVIDKQGVIPEWEQVRYDEGKAADRFGRLNAKNARAIEAEWCKGKDCAWTFSTELPHATFDIMEDGELFCRGIVIDAKDM